jgi:predicted molibdopterin-dependent oxidoreductase YjgC
MIENGKYRVVDHPILGKGTEKKKISIYFEEKQVDALEGEPIASALMSAGIRHFRKTVKNKENRGIFCAIGRCTDCMMIVDGQPNVRTCTTLVRDGMKVERQYGHSKQGGK